jgi:extracellular elastinolytic metalloproteinase
MRHLTCRILRRPSALLVAAMLALVWASAAGAGIDRGQPRDRLAFMDSRHAPAAQVTLNARAAKLTADPPAATAALKDSLGVEGFVKLDPLTATASFVGKTNGFLTGPSSAPAADVGLDYVKANAAALGLTHDGVAALELRRDYVDILGTHHLSFVQEVNGITVFGNGVKVNVAKNGRIINVTGSPVASLAGAPAATPGISAGQAVVAAKQSVSAAGVPVTSSADDLSTRFASGDVTQLVYFKTLSGLTLAYKTLLIDDGYLVVVDAGSGKILYRDSILDSANGLAWDNRPGTVAGGTQRSYDVNGPGGSWNFGAFNALFGGFDVGLSSNNTWVYSDLNASNGASISELIRADATGNFNYAFTPFTNTTNSPCSAAYPCSWNSHYPDGAFSWLTNREQNGTQVYFFVNTFHDHLLAAPIGFTEAAGNFQLTNSSG